jgi:hypothetical protein
LGGGGDKIKQLVLISVAITLQLHYSYIQSYWRVPCTLVQMVTDVFVRHIQSAHTLIHVLVYHDIPDVLPCMSMCMGHTTEMCTGYGGNKAEHSNLRPSINANN